MNAIYIYDDAINVHKVKDQIAHGISKKVLTQLDAFRALGVDMNLWSPQPETGIAKWRKGLGLLPGFPLHTLWKFQADIFENRDFVYIRKSYIDSYLIKFLEKMKGSFPDLPVLMEIPTYPYDLEFKGIVRQLQLKKEKNWRRFLPGLVDFIVTFSEDDEIFGVPTIRTQNGIDVDSIPVRQIQSDHSTLTLIGVAVFSRWHGFDRVIEGLSRYYSGKDSKKDVRFILVGNGPEEETYRNLCKKHGLKDQIIFTGPKSGKDLDDLFNQSDLAIASLGIHRIGLEQVSTLKAREYCARGIPFVKAYRDSSFNDAFQYAYNISSDETPVDIGLLVKYHREITSKRSQESIVQELRQYAEDHLTWVKQLHPVIEVVQSLR